MGSVWLAVVIGTIAYLGLSATRIALAAAILRCPEPASAPDDLVGEQVTVLQTVRSGDPQLADVLAENVANHPGARFLWLVDEDDPEARRLTTGLCESALAVNAEVILTPPLPPGTNPKVFKLALAQDRCGELVAVLDDDTVLPTGALDRARRELCRGDLVTGLPMYRTGHGFYGRLVAAFVNGSALVTYLPVLWFTRPVTINGMFYLTRRSVLDSLGGFAAIQNRLCDDYEIAKLYRHGARRIVQSTIIHPLSTTVPGLRAYARLMRRWMFCAGQLFREELPLAAVVFVVLPSLLPLALAITAAAGGQPPLLAVVLGAMAVKAAAMAVLRWRAAGTADGPREALLEMLADLLVPLNTASALVRPGMVQWRDRVIKVDAGSIASPQRQASRR
jgi:ceramide glucosyltransferase